jgi:hypothetical protein
MTGGVLRAAGVAVLLALASASTGASGARPPVALTASPAHVELAGSGRTTVRVTNSGASRAVLDVRRAGFALDLRGEPKIVAQAGPRSAAAWLRFRPRTLTIGPGASASVTIVSKVPERVEPGDHDALLLFTTRGRVRDGLAVRVRMGVVVVVRAPGTVVRRLALRGLRTIKTKRGRMLDLVVVNRGNVTESFARGHAVISLERESRRLARLIAEPRSLRPGTRGALRFPMRRRLVGRLLARVDLLTEGGRIQRVYRLRL